MILMLELECSNQKCDAVIQDQKDTASGLVAGGMANQVVYFNTEREDTPTCDTCEQELEIPADMLARFWK